MLSLVERVLLNIDKDAESFVWFLGNSYRCL